MSQEVLDIIHRLTYQYNSDSLDRALKSVEGNSKAVENLSIKLRRLEADYEQTANIIERKNISAQIEKTRAAIAGHNDAIARTVQNSKPLRDAIEKEAGLIGQLESKLRTLKNSRQKATDIADVRKYTKEIQNAQKELNDLTGTGGGKGGILSKFGGNLLQGLGFGGGAGLALAAGGAIKDFITESSQLAKEAEGVQRAFDALDRPNLLSDLRKATRGTVSDLELMRQAVQFNNFQLPVEKLAWLFEFARKRARDTGTEMEKVLGELTGGIARQSPRILDNLGFSQVRIREEFKKTGDFAQAAFNIIAEESAKNANDLDIYADKIDNLAAKWDNFKVSAGGAINAVLNGLMNLAADTKGDLERLLSGDIDVLNPGHSTGADRIEQEQRIQEAQEETARIGRLSLQEYNTYYQQFVKDYANADYAARKKIEGQAQQMFDSLLAADKNWLNDAGLSYGQYVEIATGAFNKVMAAFGQTKINPLKITAAGLKAVPQSKEELESIIEEVGKSRNSLTSGDTDRINHLNTVEEEAKRQLNVINGVKTKERVKSHNSEYNLEKDLAKRINDLHSSIELARLKDEGETTERLRKEVDIRIAKDNEELDIQIENARKRHLLTKQAAADFETIRDLLKEKAELEFKQQSEELERRRKSQTAGYEIDAGKFDLEADRSRSSILGVNSLVGIRDQIEKERIITIQEENKRFEDLKEVYRKEGRNIEEIQLEHNSRLELINLQFFQKDAQAHLTYLEELQKQTNLFAAREVASINAASAGEAEGVRSQRNTGSIGKNRYQRLRQLIELRRQIATTKAEVERAEVSFKNADEAQASVGERLNDPNLNGSQRNVTEQEFEKAKQQADEAKAALTQAKDALDEANKSMADVQKAKLMRGLQIYQSISSAAVSAYDMIAQAGEEAADREIAARERRVTEAQRLAERGNVDALRIEEERLANAQKLKEEYAQKQRTINSALALSNSIVAVTSAAAEGGIFAPATIAATLAALVAGYSFLQGMGFSEGGYTGHGGKHEVAGVVHKGEVVFSQKDVRAFGGFKQLDDFRKGLHSYQPPILPPPVLPAYGNEFATKKELQELGKKMDVLTDAVRDSGNVTAYNSITDKELTLTVEKRKAKDKRRFL